MTSTAPPVWQCVRVEPPIHVCVQFCVKGAVTKHSFWHFCLPVRRTAGKNSVFEDMSMDEIRAMMGTVVSEDPPLDNAFANDQDYSDIINNLPAEFDAREKWGSCIHPIRYMYICRVLL